MIAGYLVHTPGGDTGSRGTGYSYILARNGIFLEAENPLLRARVLLAPAKVRGILPLQPLLELRRGRVPAHLLSLAVALMAADPGREMYAALVCDGDVLSLTKGEYRLVVPEQERGEAHVTYQVPPGTVVGVHSHGGMRAFFSSTDDADDQGFLVSVVVGHLGQMLAEARARLCVYGYFVPVRLAEVFAGVADLSALEEEWSTDWPES